MSKLWKLLKIWNAIFCFSLSINLITTGCNEARLSWVSMVLSVNEEKDQKLFLFYFKTSMNCFYWCFIWTLLRTSTIVSTYLFKMSFSLLTFIMFLMFIRFESKNGHWSVSFIRSVYYGLSKDSLYMFRLVLSLSKF